MISLIRVELTRYRTRRVILLIVAAAAVLTAIVAFKTAWDSRPLSASEIATAQAAADVEAGRTAIQTEVATCEKNPAQYLGPGTTVQECKDTLGAAATTFLPRAPLDLDGTLTGNGIGIALLLVALLIIAGSSFAGADWNSGSIRNQVLFEPRRTRVWGAKAIAVTVSSGVVSFVLLGGFWLSIYLVAADRGVPHDSGIVDHIGWHLLRAVLLAMAAALGAFAVTTIFRNSVGTLAVLFTCSIAGEMLIYVLPSGISRWSLGNNVFGWLETRLEFFDPQANCVNLGTCDAPQHISHLNAGLYLLVLLVIAAAGSWAVFRHRDI